jgi:hypothetical protein
MQSGRCYPVPTSKPVMILIEAGPLDKSRYRNNSVRRIRIIMRSRDHV